MSKKVSSELTGIVLTFGILSSFIGIKETFNIIKQILSMLNSILISFYDTTILNVMFKYFISWVWNWIPFGYCFKISALII